MEGELPRARRETWVRNGQGHAVSESRHVSMLSASGEHDGHTPRAQDTSVKEHEGNGLQSSRALTICRQNRPPAAPQVQWETPVPPMP